LSTPDAGSSFDATIADATGDAEDTGAFDVAITYANPGRLAAFEASAPQAGDGGGGDGGAIEDAGSSVEDAMVEAGPPPLPGSNWPVCACDYFPSTLGARRPITDDAGSCPGFVYSGHSACESDTVASLTPEDFKRNLWPPCCAFRDAGLVGPGEPHDTTWSKFTACAALYECIFGPNPLFTVTDDNWSLSVGRPPPAIQPYSGEKPDGASNDWYRVGNAANGPCKWYYEEAFETLDPNVITQNIGNTVLGDVGSEGAVVTSLLSEVGNPNSGPPPEECFFPDSGDAPDASDAIDAGGDGSRE